MMNKDYKKGYIAGLKTISEAIDELILEVEEELKGDLK